LIPFKRENRKKRRNTRKFNQLLQERGRAGHKVNAHVKQIIKKVKFLLFGSFPEFFLCGGLIFHEHAPFQLRKLPAKKMHMYTCTQMTRMGEFPPIDRFFTLGSLFENQKSSPNLWLLFIAVKFMQ
jgi:hypothetical protein